MPKILSLLFFVFINNSFVTSTRIQIERNGYDDILIALPSSIIPEKRTSLISSLKRLLQESSSVLLDATKGRAKFCSVSFLVPNGWGDIDAWFPNRDKSIVFEEPKAAINSEEADIVVTNPDEEVDAYTLHHQGCGKQSRRIYLPANFSTSGSEYQRGVELVRLWSEFRYGIFPEGGFEEDDRFPITYKAPRSTIVQETGCVNKPFRVPLECENAWNCDGNQISPSIMDHHYNNGTNFCEGHTSLGQIHNPEAPSKHNLLCNEEGTYFTVLRSQDFIHGKNAAPLERLNPREIRFRYIKEAITAKVFIAIDISSQMKIQNRFAAVKNGLSRFVYHDLPSGSKLNVIVFGGDENMTRVTSDRIIDDIESRVSYLETQPLPEETSASENSCPECVLNNILELIKNNSNPNPHIIMITTKLYIDDILYESLVEDLKLTEASLHVFMFTNILTGVHTGKTWNSLCKETGNSFVFLGNDYLGNLYSSFSSVLQPITKDSQIAQEYLITLDEEVLHFIIPIDDSITKSLMVSITGPSFETNPLKYDSTVLKDPDDKIIRPQKQELIPAWIFNVSNPKKGTYSLRTWRKRRATSPILVTATGQSLKKEEAIIARVWTETQKTDSKDSQPPILIFCEVRKGPFPIINATVRAFVYHPNNDGVSEFNLLDDGLGSTDITKHDGIYGRYFTNFTSIGFYTIRIKVTGGIDENSAILKGPSSHCCGATFPSAQQTVISQFTREAGPSTFEVTSVPESDPYPPSKVTDLRITRSYDDKLYILQWTAVGCNYDQGVASAYEVKLFRDRSLVRNRFFDSGLEVYNVTIETTEKATYGTQLYHTLSLMETFENGLYYIGIRAVDNAGNYGEPSNVVTIWLHSKTLDRFIDCGNGPQALQLNSAIRNHLSYTLYLFVIYILNNIFFHS